MNYDLESLLYLAGAVVLFLAGLKIVSKLAKVVLFVLVIACLYAFVSNGMTLN